MLSDDLIVCAADHVTATIWQENSVLFICVTCVCVRGHSTIPKRWSSRRVPIGQHVSASWVVGLANHAYLRCGKQTRYPVNLLRPFYNTPMQNISCVMPNVICDDDITPARASHNTCFVSKMLDGSSGTTSRQ